MQFLSCQLYDNDNDHTYSQLSEHRGLTCPEGQGACALAPSHTCSDLVPLGMKWACACTSERQCGSLTKRVSLEHSLLFCWCVGCGCFVLVEDQFFDMWNEPHTRLLTIACSSPLQQYIARDLEEVR